MGNLISLKIETPQTIAALQFALIEPPTDTRMCVCFFF
uniref:Uncharacterized protein n=1 Tax=Anguilla anguilla TaxID=7936 RepID=A0A0E9WC65_ANGAN